MRKKGAINVEGLVTGVVLMVVAFIVVFLIVGNSAGEITDAADNISGSGLPLDDLFSSTGVVLLVFMAGILIALVTLALKFGKK